jgi:succinate-semialdehyde dehydrogenase/glutarate-semialdehyde dehydrogenase|tara:strand:+ start:309 stop:1790 length:1482 start_codon:yes stop_codon:yes gene_type:complete
MGRNIKLANGMYLKDSGLLREKCYIDGGWCDADDGSTLEVINPATNEIIGNVPKMGTVEARRAIESANRAWPDWRARTAKERSLILRKWFDLIMANQDDLAMLMTAEQGKPLAESMGEISYGASFIEWFAEEAKRVYGDTIPSPIGDRRIIVTKEPIGVVGCITPWNFPNAMITRKAGPAMAAGCPVVIKPANLTPYSALALCHLAEQAGVPPGVLNVLTGKTKEIGEELTYSNIVRKISFTGSTPVGKLLMEQSASTIKKVSLELGGNAPFIVFDDADLDQAVEGAMASKYRNTGQTCVCANRFLVQDGVYDDFSKRLVKAVQSLRVGPGLEGATDQGPLINEEAVEKIEEHVDDATGKGAVILHGGKRHKLGGLFYEPTVIGNVNTQMKFAREETFGPLAPLFRFSDEDQAVQLANDTEFGLAAYFYSRDVGRVWRVSEALEYGIIGANVGIISTEVAPFGGMKESGLGREGSHYGLDEFLEIKYTAIGGI